MQNPAGLGERFQPRRDVDTVAEDVVVLGDHVAEVDANAKSDAPLLGDHALAVDHPTLHLGGAAHRVDHAGKFRQQAVAGGFYGTALVRPDLGIDQLREMRSETLMRAFLVRSHEARIACHIGGEDRGQTAGRGHCFEAQR